jgi:hypothetical protein
MGSTASPAAYKIRNSRGGTTVAVPSSCKTIFISTNASTSLEGEATTAVETADRQIDRPTDR